MQNSAEFGVEIPGEVSVDFGKVMKRMRRIRSDISEVSLASTLATRTLCYGDVRLPRIPLWEMLCVAELGLMHDATRVLTGLCGVRYGACEVTFGSKGCCGAWNGLGSLVIICAQD